MTIDTWKSEIMFGMSVGSVAVPFSFRKKIGTFPAILWAYCLLSALYVYLSPSHPYGSEQWRFDQSCAEAYATILMLPLLVAKLKPRGTMWALKFFEFYAVISSALMLSDPDANGILQVSSLDASLLAAMYPMIALRSDRAFKMVGERIEASAFTWVLSMVTLALPLAAIVHAKSATGIFTLIATGIAYAVVTRRYWALIACGVVFGLGWLTQGAELFHAWDRFEKYGLFLKWWKENADMIFGTGLGTFVWLGPIIQNQTQGIYLWMHSDPIQFLFEGGILGAVLVVPVIATPLWRSRNRPWIFCTLVGCVAMTVFQFHFRFFFPALFVLVILAEGIQDNEAEVGWPR